MSQQTMGPLPLLQQPTQHVLTRFGEAWPMLKAFHQHYNPYIMLTYSTQITAISPLALVHVFNQPLLAQCLAHII